MKKIIFVLGLFFFFSNAKATHLMGGEITWECVKSGDKKGYYVFSVKVYRDCQGIPIDTLMNLNVHNVQGLSSISLNYVSGIDISPTCNTINGPNMQFSCGGVNAGSAGNGNGAVEEHLYQSDTIAILGVPDANGWHFTWSSCCRNSAISNGLANEGFTLRAVMYSYVDSLGQVFPNNNECYDSSPKFYEKPRTILEVGNGYDPFAFSNGFTYSHNAFDPEQDSISYTWGMPLDDAGYDYLNPNSIALPFSSPYSYVNPINGIVMNNQTGRTWYPATQQGNFVTCTKVSAFKCGQLISEIFREIQVVLIPPVCNLGDTTNGNVGADTLCNVRPLVQPPFFYPATTAPYQWDTLVHCGDTVRFDFNATDNDVYPNGSQQDLLFEVSGGQFYDYYNNTPCQNPPCATFNEIGTGTTPPFIASGGSGSGEFEWITSCNHIVNTCGGVLRPSVYTFVIKVSDDFCPAPAIENTSQVISITVYPSCSNLKIPVTTTVASCSINNGTAQVSPFGGTPPYTIYWSDINGLAVNPNALSAGDYIVRVTDSTFCEVLDTITVSGPASLPTTTLLATEVSCFGESDGSISSFQSGGQAPYTYLWSNGDTSQSLSNISSGTYFLNMYDANNCITSDSVLVTEPAILQASVVSSNGVLTGTSAGGTTPYGYEFFGANGLIASSVNNFGNNFSINPIASGSYTFVVTDANGCVDSVSIIFSLNFSPTITVALSNTDCDSLTDLTITVSQDSGEVDMSTALFQSNAGYFDIPSLIVGDTIGTADLMSGGGSVNVNAYLIVGSIISSSQAIIQPCSPVSGCLGSFTITNSSVGGIEVLSQSIPDNNNYTNGNLSSVTFNNLFVNPCVPLIFTSTINSELGDVDVQTISFVISSFSEFDGFNVSVRPNPSVGKVVLEMSNIIPGDYKIIIRNIIGQEIYSNKERLKGSYKKHIDISSYGSGTYLISISNFSSAITKKIIIE